MFGATRNSKRFLEMTQFVLAFVGTCTVVDAARIQTAPQTRPGYTASVPLESEPDRRASDLARADRKRREAEQLASRRGGKLTLAVRHTRREA